MQYSNTQLLIQLFGTTDLVAVIVGTFYCLAGFIGCVGYYVGKGIRNNPKTPDTFDFKTFWRARKWNFAIGLFFALFLSRLSAYAVDANINVWLSFAYGLLSYGLPEWVMQLASKRTGISADKGEDFETPDKP
jgi:hypothetical protein